MHIELILSGGAPCRQSSLELALPPQATGTMPESQHGKAPVMPQDKIRPISTRRPKRGQRSSVTGKQSMTAESPAQCPDEVHHLRQIVDSSSIATFVVDQNHFVTHWNKACEHLTGIPASEMVGTNQQWRAFYSFERPVLADLIVDGASARELESYYPGRISQSSLVEGAYEAEDYFPNFGDTGRWLLFAASPYRATRGRILGSIETLHDVTDSKRAEAALKQSEERYRQLSITDNLTGLFNSRHFYNELKSEITRSLRYGNPLSLMFIDVDHLKPVNDAFGHSEGDRILGCLAESIRNCLRESDSAYRLGGDEFVVLLPETELDCAQLVAERLRFTFAEDQRKFASDNLLTRCSLSIGVTSYEASEEFTDFVRRADSGTYQAKIQGRNRVVLIPPRKPVHSPAYGWQGH